MLRKILAITTFWAIATGMMSVGKMEIAQAALFEQQEVDSERFVAIAVPLPQDDRYNLIVLEQQSDARPCWEENAEAGTIDPLLLTFDFSGICGRSTDSNGYSIRQVGEDLALKYRLSLQRQGDALVLMGIPLQSAQGKPLEIGRTQALKEGFLKIDLNPDWKFTRRVYQGKALGHIYFTRDVIPPESELAETQPEAIALEETQAPVNNTPPAEVAVEKTPPSKTISTSDFKVIAPLQAPVQIPVPSPPQSNVPSYPAPPSAVSSLNTIRPVSPPVLSSDSPIPVPTIAPLGRVGAYEPDVFSSSDLARLPQGGAFDEGSPPPPPYNVAAAIRRYRVYVTPSSASESNVIKGLVPDAFWTSHNGASVLQVGAFLEKEKADLIVDQLGQQGISAMIDATQY